MNEGTRSKQFNFFFTLYVSLSSSFKRFKIEKKNFIDFISRSHAGHSRNEMTFQIPKFNKMKFDFNIFPALNLEIIYYACKETNRFFKLNKYTEWNDKYS